MSSMIRWEPYAYIMIKSAGNRQTTQGRSRAAVPQKVVEGAAGKGNGAKGALDVVVPRDWIKGEGKVFHQIAEMEPCVFAIGRNYIAQMDEQRVAVFRSAVKQLAKIASPSREAL